MIINILIIFICCVIIIIIITFIVTLWPLILETNKYLTALHKINLILDSFDSCEPLKLLIMVEKYTGMVFLKIVIFLNNEIK